MVGAALGVGERGRAGGGEESDLVALADDGGDGEGDGGVGDVDDDVGLGLVEPSAGDAGTDVGLVEHVAGDDFDFERGRVVADEILDGELDGEDGAGAGGVDVLAAEGGDDAEFDGLLSRGLGLGVEAGGGAGQGGQG